MITIAPGVRMVGIKPEILLALFIVEDVYEDFGQPCKIISIVDGKHDGGPPFMSSSHYSGTAFDVAVIPDTAAGVAAAVKTNVGDQYSVTVNKDKSHLHVSYIPTQPKL